MDDDLQIQPASRKLKSGGIELGWAEMTRCPVRRPHTFAWNAEKVRIQLAIGVFVMEHGKRIGPRGNFEKKAARLLIGYC